MNQTIEMPIKKAAKTKRAEITEGRGRNTTWRKRFVALRGAWQAINHKFEMLNPVTPDEHEEWERLLSEADELFLQAMTSPINEVASLMEKLAMLEVYMIRYHGLSTYDQAVYLMLGSIRANVLAMHNELRSEIPPRVFAMRA